MMGPLNGTKAEHRVGTAIFRQSQYVFQLQKMMRFKDHILIRILDTMRKVGGKPLSDSDWESIISNGARFA